MNNIFTTHSMHGMSIHQIVEVSANCFYTRELSFLYNTPLTPAELADMAESEAAYAHYHNSNGGRDEPYEPQDWEIYGCFTQPEHARRCIELHSQMNNACAEIDAYNAPSECLADACRSPERELEALEYHFGTRHPDEPKPNPYVERGVEDRTLTVAQSLGLPDGAQPTDHDVCRMLGERNVYEGYNVEFLGARPARAGEDY